MYQYITLDYKHNNYIIESGRRMLAFSVIRTDLALPANFTPKDSVDHLPFLPTSIMRVEWQELYKPVEVTLPNGIKLAIYPAPAYKADFIVCNEIQTAWVWKGFNKGAPIVDVILNRKGKPDTLVAQGKEGVWFVRVDGDIPGVAYELGVMLSVIISSINAEIKRINGRDIARVAMQNAWEEWESALAQMNTLSAGRTSDKTLDKKLRRKQ
ncbi:hypothetical protein B0H11DRAFT_1275663 [Mycena galericulata]|nr:hypothetical protein B0H11DRAFT_1275663 [Mycena galericulata]